MSKVLVVFYSRTGYTAGIAKAIATACEADLEEIEDSRDRSGFFGLVRSAVESRTGKLPPLKESRLDPAAYDLLIIGTPVWAGTLASPVRSYIVRHNERLPPQMAFFCTMAGSLSEQALHALQAATGRTPIATLAVSNNEMSDKRYIHRLETFIKTVTGKSGLAVPEQLRQRAYPSHV